jgi:hypothetical protein
MRQPHSVRRLLRYLAILLVMGSFARAHADDRSEARSHYQAGVKYYSGGDYRAAIREFSAAQQLAPADLNNYNLALCYDKLGDAEPAIQYYRSFLDKQPNTDKRAEVEASINRLEAAVRSAAGKKADEARKADDVKPDEAAPVAPPAPSVAPAPGLAPSTESAPGPGAPSADARKPHKGPAIAGSIGTPSTASPAPTGDSQLDRVGSINIDEVRDQRVGGAGSGLADRRGGPAVAANDGAGAGPAAAGAPPTASGATPGAPAPNGTGGQPVPGPADQPKKETPLYKKWWFWAVVGVSGYVVYQLATSDSQPSRLNQPLSVAPPGGLTLLRW